MKMKRILSFLIAFVMIISIVGCNQKTIKTPENNEPVNEPAEVEEFTTGRYLGVGAGLHGEIEVEVEVVNGEIMGINVLNHKETPIIGDAAFNGITIAVLDKNSTNVDAVTGSTATSKGYIKAINNALKDVKLSDEKVVDLANEEAEQTFDVVVIGGGGAGIAAAIEAAQANASVVILEKAGSLGGNTRVAGGFNGAGTSIQAGLNNPDSADIMFEDTMKGGDYKANPELVRILAENSGPTVEWTINYLGVEIRKDFIMQMDIASYPRTHVTTAQDNYGLVMPMIEKLNELGVVIKTETPAKHIIKDDTGRVVAVKAEKYGQEITFNATKGVVLATGGFGGNFEMVGKYDTTKKGYTKTTNVSTITGDGIIMAEEIGASLVGMEYVQTNPAGNPVDGSLNLFAGYGVLDGGINIDINGNRFVAEDQRRDVKSAAYIKAAGDGDRIFTLWSNEVDEKRNNFEVNRGLYDQNIKLDTVFKADTLKEVADHYGIDFEQLQKTVDHYNEMVGNGVDEDFGRKSQLTTIKEPPYFIGCVIPSVHHTMGGVEINTSAQVMSVEGEIIPGLFAAGEVTGGIHGTNRLGGNAVADALVFGRIAGQNVVK